MAQVSIPIGFGYIHCKGCGNRQFETIRYETTRRQIPISKAVVPKKGPLALTTSELDISKPDENKTVQRRQYADSRLGQLRVQKLATIAEEEFELQKSNTRPDFKKSISLPNISMESGSYRLHRESTWNMPFVYSRYWMPGATLTKNIPVEKQPPLPPRVSVSSERRQRLRGSLVDFKRKLKFVQKNM